MNKALSPIKNNQIQKYDTPKQLLNNQNQTLSQLIKFLTDKGIKIPLSIQKKLKNAQTKQNIIKLTPITISNEDELKKLRVQLCDAEFQKKKNQQDLAQFKLINKQQRQKQSKKWQQIFNHLKQSLVNLQQNSNFKISQLKQNYEKQIQEIKTQLNKQNKTQKQTIIAQYQNKIQHLKIMNKKDITSLEQKEYKKIKEIQSNYEIKIKQLNKKYQQQLKTINNKFKSLQEVKDKQSDSKYVAILSQKKTQQKLHQKTKIQLNNLRQKLLNQIQEEKINNQQLRKQLEQSKKEIKTLKQNIQLLNQKIVQVEQNHKNKMKQKDELFNQKQRKLQFNHQQQIKQIKENYIRQLQIIQKQLQDLEIINKNKQNMHYQQIKNICQKFDQRPSRKQDILQIEKLKIKLMHKQQIVGNLGNQLKHYILQLQNKEDIYNRIFPTKSRYDKRSLNKDGKIKQNIRRKCYTSDFKFLLKVSNKP